MAHITKRGEAYRIVASSGYTVGGKQVQPSMTWRPDPGMTPRQIEKELQRQVVLFDENCKNSSSQSGHVKMESFIEQYFLEYANLSLRERTTDSYIGMKVRTNQALGHLYMDKITPHHIQKFINNLGEPGINQRTGGGLAPKSIKNYIAFLSSVFSYALRMEMISTNPCTNVMPPTPAPQKRDWYTLEEAQEVLDSLEDAPLKYQAFFILAIFCGYRREELCGFEWQDIDFDKRLIAVNRASLYTKNRGIYTDVPKTEGSKRILRQPQIVFDILRRWRGSQTEMRLAMGDRWNDTGRIFTAEDGKPIHPNTPYGWLKRHCASHSIRFLGVHAFRHLNAALLISTGADVQTVAANLGHSQPSTTLNIYAYEFAEAKAAANEAVADALNTKIKRKAQ